MTDAKQLLPHQERVVEEAKALEEKIVKLKDFTDTDKFWSVDSAERNRLQRQHSAMLTYLWILKERIEAF